MKLIYFSDSAIPSRSPNSIHVMKMCQAFANSKDNIEVILYGKTTKACFKNIKDIYSYYNVTSNFKLKIIPKFSFYGSGLFYNLVIPFFVIFSRADIFYCRSIIAAFFGVVFKKNVVFEMHEPFLMKGFRLEFMFKTIIESKSLNKLVVISEALKTYTESNYNIDKLKIIVAHDGADPIDFDNANKINFKNFSVGYVGSLYEGKGMEIIADLSFRMPNVDFHIVGGLPTQIAEWQTKLGKCSNIFFHGFKKQNEIASYLLSFDILIAPYLNEVLVSKKKGANNLALWMSPLKLFEYMSAGKPILTSNLPVIKEILTHNETAFLCDPSVIDDWGDSIEWIKQNPKDSAKISLKAFEKFSSKYTWAKRAEHLIHKLG